MNCSCLLSRYSQETTYPVPSHYYTSSAYLNVNNNNDDNTLFLPGTILGPVINLSSFQLTPAMLSLLSKGLNFCPAPGIPDKYELRKDLDKFHTSLRRKQFFDKRPTSTLDTDTSVTLLSDPTSDSEVVSLFLSDMLCPIPNKHSSLLSGKLVLNFLPSNAFIALQRVELLPLSWYSG